MPSGAYSRDVALNLMVVPEKTVLVTAGAGYTVGANEVATMMEVISDGSVVFQGYGDTANITLYRYKGVQYAGRIKSIDATTAIDVALWICRANASNMDDLVIKP